VVVLAGPPGRIHAIVPIALPRPRDQIATRQMPAFLHYRAQIHDAVRASGG
jgi:NitT/TauT family transport system ATP-binding protein